MIDSVVKIGGGLVGDPVHLDLALEAVRDAARRQRVLVVPGGGPFAALVRQLDGRFRFSDETAHWMAILGMDQCAELVIARLKGAIRVTRLNEIAELAASEPRGIPVLAPYAWLRDADPLPHSWDVTSDSIAAWIAGEVAARQLVLVKPAGATGNQLVDPFFWKVVPGGVKTAIVPADQIAAQRLDLAPA
jgi:5-(aminomethyl)-3-furanmethanol phosphate kinase